MLRLDVSDAFVDVLAFDAAVERGDLASLEVAVGLYRGPLLAECAEEWVLQERQAREQLFLGALETLAQAARDAGDLRSAERHLRRAATVRWSVAGEGGTFVAGFELDVPLLGDELAWLAAIAPSVGQDPEPHEPDPDTRVP